MWKQTKEGIIVPIKVIPRSIRNEILGWEGEELKIRIKAVPDQGKANEELISFLAQTLKISKSSIILTHGQTSRHKKVFISGINIDYISNLI